MSRVESSNNRQVLAAAVGSVSPSKPPCVRSGKSASIGYSILADSLPLSLMSRSINPTLERRDFS